MSEIFINKSSRWELSSKISGKTAPPFVAVQTAAKSTSFHSNRAPDFCLFTLMDLYKLPQFPTLIGFRLTTSLATTGRGEKVTVINWKRQQRCCKDHRDRSFPIIYLGRKENGKELEIFQMKWTCERILTTPDMYYAWYRAYVLLADWAMSIPEFRALPLTDQVNFLRFIATVIFRQPSLKRISLPSVGWPMPTGHMKAASPKLASPWATVPTCRINKTSSPKWIPSKYFNLYILC